MDIGELKKMLRNSATVLILDNGEPSFVVLNYEVYKSLADKSTSGNGQTVSREPVLSAAVSTGSSNPGEIELLERINKDIMALKAEIEKEEQSLGVE